MKVVKNRKLSTYFLSVFLSVEVRWPPSYKLSYSLTTAVFFFFFLHSLFKIMHIKTKQYI